ncbi:transmembrane protein, putative [Medicago truncatula]|uniref:Transmembrane protein, putative n=1 Tax=Medicago truncatula TaxID=3880 RepID=A0A072TGF2_MEDTR|nr:transmembrane protein, putative [Medicago truncatula]
MIDHIVLPIVITVAPISEYFGFVEFFLNFPTSIDISKFELPKIGRRNGATRCTGAPAYAGSGKGSHYLVYCTQSYSVLHKRLFPGLEPVTFQSHDNNFTSCVKVTLEI